MKYLLTRLITETEDVTRSITTQSRFFPTPMTPPTLVVRVLASTCQQGCPPRCWGLFRGLTSQLSYAIKNQLGYPKPPTRGISCLPYTGSLWHKGAYNRIFPLLEANYPYAIKKMPGSLWHRIAGEATPRNIPWHSDEGYARIKHSTLKEETLLVRLCHWSRTYKI